MHPILPRRAGSNLTMQLPATPASPCPNGPKHDFARLAEPHLPIRTGTFRSAPYPVFPRPAAHDNTPESFTMASMLTSEKLRAIRALRGISQAELAQKAGVSPTAIAEYERDKRDLRSGTIRKLCEALGVKVRYYVDETEITGP